MGTSKLIDIGTLITVDPALHSGRPCLSGTGMTVHAIAARHQMGMTAEQILDQFPHLDLSRIHAALAYYFANRDRIDAELTADEDAAEAMAAKHPRGWRRQSA